MGTPAAVATGGRETEGIIMIRGYFGKCTVAAIATTAILTAPVAAAQAGPAGRTGPSTRTASTAHAGPVTQGQVRALAACAVSGTRSAPGSVTNDGRILNVGIGAIHVLDGNCTHTNYDAILSAGQDTYHALGWGTVEGVYIGSGYGAQVYLKDSSGGLHRTPADMTGPTTWQFSGGNYVLRPYRR
jgi:hypothetical protein